MDRRPPRSTRTDTLFPSPTLVRSPGPDLAALQCRGERRRYMGIAAMTLRLHGYPVSQYFNAARAALIEKGTDFQVIPTRAAQDDAFQIGRAHVELQSLMRISYAVFCLKKKKNTHSPVLIRHM